MLIGTTILGLRLALQQQQPGLYNTNTNFISLKQVYSEKGDTDGKVQMESYSPYG
jgi:hypothetical protein